MCQHNGGTLLSIDSAFENMEMQRVFAIDESICDRIFIGYHRNPNGTWVWDNGDLSKYSSWKYGYPTSQNCALMQLDGKDAGLWTDEDCSHLECYMCQIVL
uniref:C-type lectin domain-containing protein n=1 Tax=Acrobeloides nanus TaxID=290746 RepID=A0A914EFI7_9BILA